MRSLWNEQEARAYKHDPLGMRVYTSRLLGRETHLVLHGGGNTSVKLPFRDILGDTHDVLYVKGSGWDLATIEKAGFAPVKMEALLKMARLKRMTDTQMVAAQRAAMVDPYAPTPSVEAILHAIIPYRYVDHTHADAVVAVSNTPDGERHIRDIYGDSVLVIPYVMPGFILAKYIFEKTRNVDWKRVKGIVLLHHGVFSFADDAKESYEQMVRLVSKAEAFLKKKKAIVSMAALKPKQDLVALARLRKVVSGARGGAVLAQVSANPVALHMGRHKNMQKALNQGPLTPDHIIRTKRVPLIVSQDGEKCVARFVDTYSAYFRKHHKPGQMCLDAAPRWALWPEHGAIAFGRSVKENAIIHDIVKHTLPAIMSAEKLGGWKALKEKDLFEMEYWELEQAKLKASGKVLPFQGKVVLVTGAASGIGEACVEAFADQGACVAAVDIDAGVSKISRAAVRGIQADLTRDADVAACVRQTVEAFGGLDVLVSNAGIFPASFSLEAMEARVWDQSLAVNVTSHQRLLTAAIPYLRLGVDPAVVFIGSKNVPAPGPGAAAYSAAKAALTQLGRVAALELGRYGIRVNTIHPNQVFDTGVWTSDVLKKRAKHYGVSVDEYKRSNVLSTVITSVDVARMVLGAAGEMFSKTTGAQIPLDGGNERVI